METLLELLTMYRLLLAMQLREMRTSAGTVLVFSTMFPVVMTVGLGVIGGGVQRSGLLYVVTGAAVVSVVTIGIAALSQELSEMRHNGSLVYYASLPIHRTVLIGAVLSSRMLVGLPGPVATLVFGNWLYGLRLSVTWMALLLLPVTVLAVSGIGAAIGVLLEDLRAIVIVSQGAVIAALFASPVLIPESDLPRVLNVAGYLFPPTYAADGLRRAVTGVADERFWIDVIVLGFCAAVSLAGIARYLPWRDS